MIIDHAIHRIRSFARHHRLAIYRFAVQAGVNESTIRNLHSPHWNPTAETLRKLESIIPPEFSPEAIAAGASSSIPNQKANSHETTSTEDC